MSGGNTLEHLRRVVRWLLAALIPGVAFMTVATATSPMALGKTPQVGLEPTLLALGRLAVLVLCGWLLLTQILYTVAILTHAHRLVEVLGPVTLPLIRRVAAGLTSVTVSLSAMTAAAQAPTETTVVVVDFSNLRQEATPTPNLQPIVEVEAEKPSLPDEIVGSYSAPLTWLVRPGDHLWKIAGEHLTIVLDRPPIQDEHARYWAELVDAARPVIRSGDPDLVYPGEQIPLPPTLDAGVRP